MGTELRHHGILGMKWGIRRTPEQLGHAPKGNPTSSANAKKAETKTPGKTKKPTAVMSDDELRQRITRLNMEEQYTNLVARQKERNTGTVKKLLKKAAANLGDRALGVGIDKIIDFMRSNGKTNIQKWKDADVNRMDLNTIQDVSKWYAQAELITKKREALKNNAEFKKEDKS